MSKYDSYLNKMGKLEWLYGFMDLTRIGIEKFIYVDMGMRMHKLFLNKG